jgi:hypothetical protein
VGGTAVGDTLIVGCAVVLVEAGVLVGGVLHAVKIIPSPIATLKPNILEGNLSFIVSSPFSFR